MAISFAEQNAGKPISTNSRSIANGSNGGLAWSHAVIRDCHGLACSSKCSAPPGTSSFQNYSAKLTGVMDAACRCDFLYSSTYAPPGCAPHDLEPAGSRPSQW